MLYGQGDRHMLAALLGATGCVLQRPQQGSTQSQYAAFAASPQLGFESDYARVNRNALALRAGLNYQASDRLSMGLTAATRVLADSRAEFSGNLALRWAF